MVGALAGCSHGTVSNCYSTGSVSGDSGVGGLVGSNYFGTISKCYSTADVTAYGVNAGGLVGTNEFKVISDSYATGSVGTQSAPGSGGFCGANNATILNCYSTGRTYGGGLVGWCNGTATNSYWDMETSEKDWSAAGEGKTTGQMKHQSTFNGWDFVNTWTIQEGLDYPRLVWEAGPPIVKDFYLHGVAPALTLDNVAPTGTTPKYKDSPSINRTTYKEVGTWTFVVPLGTTATIDSLADIRTWIGLKNSDDQGTYFDLCAELAKNGTLIGFGETTNIQGVTRNADKAKEVTVGFGSISDRNLAAGDTLSLRILTKVTAAGGHSSAVGLRLYYDALSRPSRLTPSPTP